jgi:hypothetical protein
MDVNSYSFSSEIDESNLQVKGIINKENEYDQEL